MIFYFLLSDWYNLEKSKRVKAFRCGEFDDCIERAESSQGMPPKKREKYARREDAILHALELEKELLRKQGKLDRPSDARSKSSGSAKRDSAGSDISDGKPGNSKSNQSRSPDTSIKGETVSIQVDNHPSWENDHAEIIPQMRGLQDLGLKTACAKQKLTSFGALDVDDTLSPSSRVSSMGRNTHINGISSLDERKRSHEGFTEEFLVNRCEMKHPFDQVLHSSVKLEVHHFLQPAFDAVYTSISGGERMGGVFRAKRRDRKSVV